MFGRAQIEGIIVRDLYTVLGVSRTATADEITAAYRLLAKKYHPDRNPGDEEAKVAYAAVDNAYSVLSEPGRRAHYDATGEIDDPRTRTDPKVALMAVLVPVMAEALNQMVSMGERPEKTNVVAYMRRVIESERKELKHHLEKLEKARAAFAVTDGRFQEPEGEEALLAAAARHHLTAVDSQIEQTVATDVQLGKALDYLARCKYEFEAVVSKWGDPAAFVMGHFNARNIWGQT